MLTVSCSDGVRVTNEQMDMIYNSYDKSDSEMTAEELFDLFINGSINAVDPTDLTSAFYITDLNMDSEEWDSFSVGEEADLDFQMINTSFWAKESPPLKK